MCLPRAAPVTLARLLSRNCWAEQGSKIDNPKFTRAANFSQSATPKDRSNGDPEEGAQK
jgi:hypothetical protein